ncbi:MAG: hypothetical protein AAGB16_07535 [Pseudomonadota bacterium]
MFRFLSFLLILAGAAALAFGGYQYMQTQQEAAPLPQNASGFDIASSPATKERSAPSPDFSKSGFDDDMAGVAMTTNSMVDSLQRVPIAHETPSRAQFGRAFTVTVAIDATGDDTAADALPGTGNVVEGTAQISGTVRAQVSGEAFTVRAITPETQRVSPLTENVWRFKVTPTAIGNQDLVIELFAIFDGEALPLRTFRDSVEVRVSRIGQAIAFAESVSPITIVAGGIGSLLAGLFGFIGFFRK